MRRAAFASGPGQLDDSCLRLTKDSRIGSKHVTVFTPPLAGAERRWRFALRYRGGYPGPAAAHLLVLKLTNLAGPRGWAFVATNYFNSDGSFRFTNAVSRQISEL